MARRWWSLLAVCTALFMLLLDITIVNVALPDIERELDASFSQLQWVVDAYALSLASLLLTAGSLADLYGRRLVFTIGLVIFTASSAACALSSDPMQLILSRSVQGIGGAMMFATSLAIVADGFRGKQRGVALGLVGATTGLAVAVGPTAGGALTTGIGWEWIFLINVPIGIAALVMTVLRMDESRNPNAGGVDWPALFTFSGSLFTLVLALIEGPGWGWSDGRTVGLLVTSAVLMLAFVLVELRATNPMFDLELLKNRTFVGAAIVAFCVSASIFACFLFIILWMQGVLGYDAFEAGLRFLPMSGLSFIAAAVSGRLTETLPKAVLLGFGLVFVTVALGWMSLLQPGDDWTALLPGFLIAGIGIGMVNPAIASTAVGVVAPDRSGMASGINSTFRQVGIATGIAGLGALFRHATEDGIVERLSGTSLEPVSGTIGAAVASGGSAESPGMAQAAPAAVRELVSSAIGDSVTTALGDVLQVAAVIAGIGAVAAFVLVRDAQLYDLSGDER
jgi:EmrB/QacA subfamily drug resistance transporter